MHIVSRTHCDTFEKKCDHTTERILKKNKSLSMVTVTLTGRMGLETIPPVKSDFLTDCLTSIFTFSVNKLFTFEHNRSLVSMAALSMLCINEPCIRSQWTNKLVNVSNNWRTKNFLSMWKCHWNYQTPVYQWFHFHHIVVQVKVEIFVSWFSGVWEIGLERFDYFSINQSCVWTESDRPQLSRSWWC